jgi:RNA polymerase sigma factor (sigma-70 family)
MSISKKSYHTRQSLLMRLKDSHDDASWEEFVSTYRNYILSVINNLKVSHHDSEDLLQSILLKLWNKLPEFEYDPGKGQFRYWLGRVTKNDVFKHFDKKKRLLENIPDNESENGLSSEDPEIHKMIEREWQNYIAERAWENISSNFGSKILDVFHCFADGLKGPEVAEKMGMAENTAYVYKLRVQKALHKEMMRLEFELG